MNLGHDISKMSKQSATQTYNPRVSQKKAGPHRPNIKRKWAGGGGEPRTWYHGGIGFSVQIFSPVKAPWGNPLNVNNGQLFPSLKSNLSNLFFHQFMWLQNQKHSTWGPFFISFLVGAGSGRLSYGQKLDSFGTFFFLLKDRTLNSIPAGRAERFKFLRKLNYKTLKAETTQQVTTSTLSKLLNWGENGKQGHHPTRKVKFCSQTLGHNSQGFSPPLPEAGI